MSGNTRAEVLIIGAGPAGLAAAAALKAMQIPFDLVDSQNHVGGVWNVANDDAPSWPSKLLTSSKENTQFPDLRMPVSFPAFPSTDEYATYLRAYASHHGLVEDFEPNMRVVRLRSFGTASWEVEFANGEIRAYSVVISAHGISNHAFVPAELFIQFKDAGVKTMHSKNFPGAEFVEEQNVLVVGSGQCAADVATELADGSRNVALLAHEGHWVVPRQVGPFAADQLAFSTPSLLSPKLKHKIATTLVDKLNGKPQQLGLPTPQVDLLDDEPIVSDSFLQLIQQRKIHVIKDAGRLPFESYDLVVFATGYEPGADYLQPELSEDLYLGAFPRDRHDLIVLGQVRVAGAVTPVLVEQADIAAYAVKALLNDEPELSIFAALKSSGRNPKALESTVLSDDQALQLPLTDRNELLRHLKNARSIFEK